MASGPQHKPYASDTGGAGRRSTGIQGLYIKYPVSLEVLKKKANHNGECRVTKPADPGRVMAYREAISERKKGKRRWGK